MPQAVPKVMADIATMVTTVRGDAHGRRPSVQFMLNQMKETVAINQMWGSSPGLPVRDTAAPAATMIPAAVNHRVRYPRSGLTLVSPDTRYSSWATARLVEANSKAVDALGYGQCGIPT